MARIRTLKSQSSIRVVVAGRFRATDFRRLERACSAALTTEGAQLVVDIHRVTEVDSVAAAHLHPMASRGAVIRKGPTDTCGTGRSWDGQSPLTAVDCWRSFGCLARKTDR
jgi:hypothetical protein